MTTLQNEVSPLERYGHNLTLLAQQGAFPPHAGQEAVINKVFDILLHGIRNRYNPVIVDWDETRRWAVVAEVIRRMAVGDAPDPLPKKQVTALDYEALFAGLPDEIFKPREPARSYPFDKLINAKPGSEEWAFLESLRSSFSSKEDTPYNRLRSIFTAMQQSAGSFLLFVDHLHRLIGGEWERYPIDAAPLLKPALARREIQLIGACTLGQFRSYIERDAPLQRRLQPILLPSHQPEFKPSQLCR